jgi:hypothetical protein
MSLCTVFTCDSKYFKKFQDTFIKLRCNGKYNGTVCLIVGNDLRNIHNNNFIIQNKIIVKYFPNLPILSDSNFLSEQQKLARPSHWFYKRFQYHKLYLFDKFFKKWNYVLYLDCGMEIYDDISPILNEIKEHTLLANRDGVDNETGPTNPITPGKGLKIGDQFVKTHYLYNNLESQYKMDMPYFQTTMLLYDTKIISENTFNDLYKLLLKYPISITNDQGIIALYFTQIKPCWKQIRRKNEQIYFYDYVRCVNKKYILVKNPSDKWINVGYN